MLDGLHLITISVHIDSMLCVYGVETKMINPKYKLINGNAFINPILENFIIITGVAMRLLST